MSVEQTEETRVVIVAHGSYATGLRRAAEAIVGPLPVQVVEVAEHDDRAALRERIAGAAGAGPALLVTDLVGSTPANVCVELAESGPGDWAVFFCLGLAALVKLASAKLSRRPTELAALLAEATTACARYAGGRTC